MPALINKYRIFLASPSDLSEEREAINEVISELNITYGNPNNIVIELLKWETNAAPGISDSEIQSLINSDIPDYDIFIGLLWMKFGTPTKLFGSGTEEEFNVAYNKFKKLKNSVQILFYFKNASPQSLEDVNPLELFKVREFKSTLGEKNVLYWEFNLKDELERYLRIHIPARIDTLKGLNNTHSVETSSIELINSNINNEDEYGIIDYQELIEESFTTSTDSLKKITDAIYWIGKEINKKTEEIDKLIVNNRNQSLSIKVQRNLFDRTAIVMNDFANRIDPEIPIYISNFEMGIDSFSKLVNIYRSDFDGNREDEITEANTALESLLDQISGTLDNMHSFLHSIEALPRMSKELNKARRNVTEKLGALINRLEISHSIASEVHKSI